MPTLFQINCDANWGSIGRIVEQIGLLALNSGWNSYVAYGRDMNTSQSRLIKIGNKLSVYEHYLENVLFDNEGRAARIATKKLIKKISKINPDIIHIHNIHDHYINYKILFSYLAKLDTPVVWTHHDCWAFTGGCMYYSMAGCYHWKDGCKRCPQRRAWLIDNSCKNYISKKKIFNSIKNLTLVPVSIWLSNEIRQSFLKKHNIVPIINGVDTNVFRPINGNCVRKKYGIGMSIFYLAAATAWTARKGLLNYIKLATLLKKDEKLVLVGLSNKQSKDLPNNIIAIPRTQNQEELAMLYSEATVVLNLSYEETFGLTTVEGFACGTPSVVFNCTASPELITNDCGRIVEKDDIQGVYKAIRDIMLSNDEVSLNCRERAVLLYDKNINFTKYMDLYYSLLK